MATKSKYISDIELRLSGGTLSDDISVSRAQIGHWLDIVRDEILTSELEKFSTDPANFDPDLIDSQEFTAVTEETPTALNDKRYYVTLTNTPLSLRKDRGIVRVLGEDGELINKTRITEFGVVDKLRHSKATTTNLLYYRKENKVYIQGMDTALVDNYSLTVYYIRSYAASPVAEADEFKTVDKLIPIMLDEVETIARRQTGTPEDIINDGVEE